MTVLTNLSSKTWMCRASLVGCCESAAWRPWKAAAVSASNAPAVGRWRWLLACRSYLGHQKTAHPGCKLSRILPRLLRRFIVLDEVHSIASMYSYITNDCLAQFVFQEFDDRIFEGESSSRAVHSFDLVTSSKRTDPSTRLFT